MKSIKKLSLILAATLTLGGVAMANEAREGKRNLDPKARAEKMTERMAKEYNLDDTQKQQLLVLNQTITEKIGDRPAGPRHHKKEAKVTKDKKERKERPEAPKLSAEAREKKMQEMKQARDNYNAQLQKIMNAEQYQAFAKKQTEREQKRKEQGEKMKENRGRKPAAEKKNQNV